MTASFTDLIDYLTLTGWRRESSGQSGSVWRREGWSKPLPVLDDLSSEDYEWASTVERSAVAVDASPREIHEAIGRMYFDVQEFRAADDIYIKGSIPVEAGFTLFSSARAMIRAAAATARSNKARIGGNYGPAALRIAEKARFGHTIDGSYIVPLLMPLDRPQEPTSDTPLEFEGELLNGASADQTQCRAPMRSGCVVARCSRSRGGGGGGTRRIRRCRG